MIYFLQRKISFKFNMVTKAYFMAKNKIISIAVFASIVIMNVVSISYLYRKYRTLFEDTLTNKVEVCGEKMETILLQFTSDINQELNKYQYLFEDESGFNEAALSLQMFYIKYRNLITRISIYDNEKNYYAIYLDSDDSFGLSDHFVIDSYPMKTQKSLVSRHRIEQNGSVLRYYYPYFGDDMVTGNVVVEVDISRLAGDLFAFFPSSKILQYIWIMDVNGELITHNGKSDTLRFQNLEPLIDSIKAEAFGLYSHGIITDKGKEESLLTAYYPLSIYSRKMGVMFSGSLPVFSSYYIHDSLGIYLFSLIVGVSLTIYLLIMLDRAERNVRRLKLSEISYRQLIEHFPVGIMIVDEKNIIRNVNSAAQKMLFLDKADNMVGKDFSKQFLITNKYLLSDTQSPFMDDSHYLYHEKDGIETVIYRSQREASIGGEQLKLTALIDVSPLEKSRKGEVAANKAKSDFLAAMSHEIRTPMNGILGMVNALLEQANDPAIHEKIGVIKRSSDLLLNIINDILDFSKIEAGRMMLEEIPFRISEELELVRELFLPLAEEKGLALSINLKDDVPMKLIGDPFRLRQVISNLVSNAIKFTDKGSIVIGASLIEAYKNQVNILFTVEDTGIGIPQDRIKEIFGSYTQARGSVTRKFGGTGLGTAISKQLVELMHGEIWVESPSTIGNTDNPGSKFSFTISAYSNERIPKEFDYSSINSLSEIKALILTKESSSSQNTMSRLLERFGLQVKITVYQDSTVDSIIHHLQVNKDNYNLIVLMDKNKLDGFALAQEMKNRELIEHFPVVLVSSNDRSGNYKTCRKLGIDYYLIEPFETKEVFDILSDNFPMIKDQKKLEPLINTLPVDLKILCAEDNLINQKVAKSIFKNIGYEIDLAKNGLEAVEMVAKTKYDVVFMDLLMPELDGLEATEAIRKAGYEQPIVAMSADDDEESREAAFSAGMNDYLNKPARVESVKQLLIKFFSTSI